MGVFAQRYNAAGVAQGSEFQVNTVTTSFQSSPSVALAADGDIVVAWNSGGQDGSDYGVYAQRYDAAGVPQGFEFAVNTYTTNQQQNPAVAMDASGNSVVTWESYGQDGSGYGVYARRYLDVTPPAITGVMPQSGEGAARAADSDTTSSATSSIVVRFSKDMSTSGGAGGANSVTNPANYQLLDGMIDISDSITAITYGFNLTSGHFEATLALDTPLLGGPFQLTARDTLNSKHGVALDGDGNGTAGGDFVTGLEVASTVTGRHLFYEHSKWDGNSIGIGATDTAAIAPDKTAYLPGAGSTITPASMSSYSRGLNGLFVDLTGPHGTLSLADFGFKMSNQGSGGTGANNTPSTWSAAPAPTAFTVLSDNPVVGTDRVEFIWADNAIDNRYLEVRTFGNDAGGGNNTNTGLAATDIFYFGNIRGDTFVGTGSTVFLTSGADEISIQASPIISAATITSPFDMDRNGTHTGADRIVTRGNTIFALTRIDIASPPAAPAPPAGDEDALSAVASALAIPSPGESPPSASSSAAPLVMTDASHHLITAGVQAPAAAPRAGVDVQATDAAIESLDLDEDLIESLLADLCRAD